MLWALELTGDHVMYNHCAQFLSVIISSLRSLCCLPSVMRQKHGDCLLFFCSMYNETIIRFHFCDIQNNQGLSEGYQPRPSTSAELTPTVTQP